MNTKLFQKLRELQAKATTGPWSAEVDLLYSRDCMNLVGPYTTSEGCSSHKTEFNHHEDAEFIAEARNTIPKLLAVIDLLYENLEEADGIIQHETSWKFCRKALEKAREIAGDE